jgi:hypothetical protein
MAVRLRVEAGGRVREAVALVNSGYEAARGRSRWRPWSTPELLSRSCLSASARSSALR